MRYIGSIQRSSPRRYLVTNFGSLGLTRLLEGIASFIVLYDKHNNTKAGNGAGTGGVPVRS